MKPLGSDPASQLPAASVSTAPDDDGPIAALPAPGTTQDPRADDISKVLVAGGTGGVGRCVAKLRPAHGVRPRHVQWRRAIDASVRPLAARCREVVRQLSAKGIQVVALVRDINKAASKLPTANVQLVQGDLYQYDTIPGALQGCDAVICAASTREFLDPLGPFKVDFSVRCRFLVVPCCFVTATRSRRPHLRNIRPDTVGRTLQGTVNLIDCARKEGVDKFVLVSSIGADDGLLSPLGPVLFWKKRAEEHLQRSPLQHTIVRPGGLVSDAAEAAAGAAGASKSPVAALLEAVFGSSRTRGEGNLVFGSAGAFGLPPKRSGSVKRSKVRRLPGTGAMRAHDERC